MSYVLNNSTTRPIAEATRDLVLRTAAELGHVPYAPARALRLGRSNIVVALVPGFGVGPITDALLDAFDAAIGERGMALLVHRYTGQGRPLAELWPLVQPALVISVGGLTIPDISSIQHSDAKLFSMRTLLPHERMGRMQVDYLVSRGHRRLGYAFPMDPAAGPIASERLEGVRAACREHGLPPPVVCVIDQDGAGVEEAVSTWLAGEESVSVVCAYSDLLALAVAAGVRDAGYAVPEDLALIGIDDFAPARGELTTVRIDVKRLIEAGVESVMALLDDRDLPEFDGSSLLEVIPRRSA